MKRKEKKKEKGDGRILFIRMINKKLFMSKQTMIKRLRNQTAIVAMVCVKYPVVQNTFRRVA